MSTTSRLHPRPTTTYLSVDSRDSHKRIDDIDRTQVRYRNLDRASVESPTSAYTTPTTPTTHHIHRLGPRWSPIDMSHLFPQQSYPSQPYGQNEPLAFFGGSSSSSSASPYYPGGRSSLEGNMGGAGPSGSAASGYAATGNMNMNSRVGGMMSGEGRWWEAFGTGGFEGEPSLMEGGSCLVIVFPGSSGPWPQCLVSRSVVQSRKQGEI